MIIDCQKEIEVELARGIRLHGHFASPHEAYAVILEELDEFWDELKKKRPDRQKLHDEMVQVGAMALKFLVEFKP